MAIVRKTTKEKLVKTEVDVYKLELTPDEFVTLRVFLGGTSYTDIVNVKGLDEGDDKRVEAIYIAMSTLDSLEVNNASD